MASRPDRTEHAHAGAVDATWEGMWRFEARPLCSYSSWESYLLRPYKPDEAAEPVDGAPFATDKIAGRAPRWLTPPAPDWHRCDAWPHTATTASPVYMHFEWVEGGLRGVTLRDVRQLSLPLPMLPTDLATYRNSWVHG